MTVNINNWIYLCRTDREFDRLMVEADRQCSYELRHQHSRNGVHHCALGLVRAEEAIAARWNREWVNGVGWPTKRAPIALGPAPVSQGDR